MTNKASIHFEHCNEENHDLEVNRDKEYLASVKEAAEKKNSHVFYRIKDEFTHLNTEWHSDYLRYKNADGTPISATQLYAKMQERYSQTHIYKTSRNGHKAGEGKKPNLSSYQKLIKGKNKKYKKTFWAWSPLREGVCTLSENVTMDDLLNFTTKLENKYNIKVVSIHIHEDEGHFKTDKKTGEKTFVKNRHAHILTDWMNWDTGRVANLKEDDIRDIQTMLAQSLNMERGVASERKHRDVEEEREYEELQRQIAEKKQELADLETKVKDKISIGDKVKAKLDSISNESSRKKAEQERDSMKQERDSMKKERDEMEKERNEALHRVSYKEELLNERRKTYDDHIDKMDSLLKERYDEGYQDGQKAGIKQGMENAEKKLNEQIESLKNDNQTLQKTNKTLESDKAVIEKENKTLKERLDVWTKVAISQMERVASLLFNFKNTIEAQQKQYDMEKYYAEKYGYYLNDPKRPFNATEETHIAWRKAINKYVRYFVIITGDVIRNVRKRPEIKEQQQSQVNKNNGPKMH